MEANHSPNPPPTVYHLAADKFNDPEWSPTTPDFSRYSSHLSSRVIHHAPTFTGCVLTPEKAKQQFKALRTIFTVVHTNYKKSGNGDGQNAGVDDNGIPYVDGTDKLSFCKDKKGNILNYVLFFWLSLEEMGSSFIDTTLCQLNADTKGDSESVPKMMSRKKPKKDDEYSKQVANLLLLIAKQGEQHIHLEQIRSLHESSSVHT
jgi:hypothetical protein